ncbi:selenium cofactor biosynthesis protein YqeC [Rubrobacter marinus]|uniref:selenium cofactor biosynthesis protein YqeC n=1 Tax=Rubrobacter marinus TaxID=2653852 RepID=UPI00140B7677|nr:selenium cofactor biosynthesis protein YqeC [Rubrobacter marinus]
MELYRALGVVPGDVVAFVGAGGKSSAILQAADELKRAGVKVLAVPTTKMFVSEARRIGPIVTGEDAGDLRLEVGRALEDGGVAVAGSGMLSRDRVGGVEAAAVPSLAPKGGVTLVEADGSRRRPIKGTADHEPPLPEGATLVVAVGGIDALGQTVDEEHVHRPEVFAEITGAGPGHTITPLAFARALLAGLRNAPQDARLAALLAGVMPGSDLAAASTVARELWRGGVRKVVSTSLPKEDPGRVWTL